MSVVVFSLAVKAVHLQAVTDQTTNAFITTLPCFVARKRHPSLIWSDNGTNFVGENHELEEL